MRELVDRLDGSQRVRHLVGLGAAGVAILCFGLAAGWDRPPSCGDAQASLSAAYSPVDGDRVEAALAEFESIGPAGAAQTRARLDAYARDWLVARRAACLETAASDPEVRTHGTHAVRCLDYALTSFDTVTTLLARPDATVAANHTAVCIAIVRFDSASTYRRACRLFPNGRIPRSGRSYCVPRS